MSHAICRVRHFRKPEIYYFFIQCLISQYEYEAVVPFLKYTAN